MTTKTKVNFLPNYHDNRLGKYQERDCDFKDAFRIGKFFIVLRSVWRRGVCDNDNWTAWRRGSILETKTSEKVYRSISHLDFQANHDRVRIFITSRNCAQRFEAWKYFNKV